MPIKINFDDSHNVEQPTFVLSRRDGERIGALPIHNLILKDDISCSEFSCRVSKYRDGVKYAYWDEVEDLKLVWCRNWDKWFEISVEIDEADETEKIISAVILGKAELSQIKLHDIEINTENDIARDDYIPTIFYNNKNHDASLLHRITQKAPHYHFNHVDDSISNIQRTFTFDDISIDDAFQEIEKEIECIFIMESGSDSNGNIDRSIDVYDLKSCCCNCGERGDFLDECPECGSRDILPGYGEDTTIFVSKDNLADRVSYSTDVNSVKNCFKLEAGDDLMTATIANCNPNGSGYLWYFSDDLKADMPSDLVASLDKYNKQYQYYQDEHAVTLDSELVRKYNEIIKKYQTYDENLEYLQNPIVGFHNLIKAYYDSIDFYLFLNDKLMPTVKLSDTSAEKQVALLSNLSLFPTSVTNIDTCSNATASSAVLSSAKTIIDSRYQVKINESSLSDLNNGNRTWNGTFTVTNYSDEEDTAQSDKITITIDDNYLTYIKQKIEITLNKKSDDSSDIASLFKSSTFDDELKKYCLNSLKIFYDSCQACLDILIEQGIADNNTWNDTDSGLYNELYIPYYNKLNSIQNEISIRESEIEIITGKFDNENVLISDGIQTVIEKNRNEIQKSLDFENFLGYELWVKLASYRREDTYTNSNYISDGLDNAQLITNALEFIKVAENEIYKSANLQHSISASLKNLLIMKEFSPIVDYFSTGNWIRVSIDNIVYRLRMVSYEIDFDNLDNLNVEFSDVTKIADGYSDVESILNHAVSISSSYDSVARQAGQGAKSNEIVWNWIEKGLDATNTKIVNSADNQSVVWDEHGILLREYYPFTDTYSSEQTKIINKGLYITNDNWKTAKTGVGNYIYYDPSDKTYKNGYGIIADTICSNLILSKRVGIYNEDNSIEIGKDGINIITNTERSNEYKSIFTIRKDSGENLFYVDNGGNLKIKGQIEATSLVLGNSVSIKQEHIDGLTDKLSELDDKIDPLQAGHVLMVGDNGALLGDFAPNLTVSDVDDSGNRTITDGDISFKVSDNGLIVADNAVVKGTIIATNGIFTGEITATGGTIGGFHVDQEKMYSKKFSLYPNGSSSIFGLYKTYLSFLNAFELGIARENDPIAVIKANGAVYLNDGVFHTANSTYLKTIGEISTVSGSAMMTMRGICGDTETEGYIKIEGGNPVQIDDSYSYRRCGIYMGYELGGPYGFDYNTAKIISNSNNDFIIASRDVIGITVDYDQEKLDGTKACIFLSKTASADGNGNGYLRGNWYLGVTEAITSDRNLKNSIENFSDEYSLFFDNLKPIRYKYNNGTSNRYHVGFIAQDVEEDIISSGLTTQDFAGFVKSTEIEKNSDTGEETKIDRYYIRYEEFIALNTNEIQKLKKRVLELESIIAELTK